MKVRYITEGIFKNPEQARAAREREREMSNQEKVVGTFNKLIGDRINYIIGLAVQKKGIYPFQLSMFSHGTGGSSIKVSKKEVKCTFGIEDDKKVIHLSFDYGKFVVGRKDCTKINLNSWAVNDWNTVQSMRKGSVLKSMVTKIINFIDKEKVFFDKHDQEICDLILGSEIVIDDISMYNEPGDVEEITFNIFGQQHWISEKGYLSDKKRNKFINDMGPGGESNYGKVMHNLMEVVDFNIPIKLFIEVVNYSPNKMITIESAFPGYKTLGDLEKGAGVPGVVMKAFMDFCKEMQYTLEQKDVELLEKEFNECSFIMFDYVDTHIGRYYKDKGLEIEKSNVPVFNSVIFGNTNRMSSYAWGGLYTRFVATRSNSNLGRYESDVIAMSTRINQGIYFYNEADSAPYRDNLLNMRYIMNGSRPYYDDIVALIGFISNLLGPAI